MTLPFLALYLPLAGCFCYPERSYWQDPLGVLATRLFFHESQLKSFCSERHRVGGAVLLSHSMSAEMTSR